MAESVSTEQAATDAGILLRTLATLRWIAVAGQSVAIVVAESVLALPLGYGPLLIGVAALLAFNAYATRVAWTGDAIGRGTVLVHVALDILQLTWQLYWSGGSANPFVSLYLLPIALVGFSLPSRQVLAVAGLAVAGYSFLMAAHRPLPNWLHHHATLFDLHLIGMWVNFLISAGVITIAAIRLSAVLGRQRRALAQARESALRSEGVIAVATQAAATAHALNTPLGSMAIVAGELARELPADAPLADDVRLLRDQIEVCREAVRRLVAESSPDARGPEPLADIVTRAVERLALIAPESAVDCTIDPAVARLPLSDPIAIEHLLMNVLGNAVEASGVAARHWAGLDARGDGETLCIVVRDRGTGVIEDPAPFTSTKPGGLGLGVLLSRMLVERRGGSLSLGRDADGGRVEIKLPVIPRREGGE
jgi:two-component system sensor histidine kinase RegB